MFLLTVVPVGLMFFGAAGAAADWRTELAAGKQAYAGSRYEEALAHFKAAESAARVDENGAAPVECWRLHAAALRDSGDPNQAVQILEGAVSEYVKTNGDENVEAAPLWEDLSALHRAQNHAEQALAAVEKAIRIRDGSANRPRPELARDLTVAAALYHQQGKSEKAAELLKSAISEWDAGYPADPQSLPALEALAKLLRDGAQYADAEPLLLRALRIREANAGPNDAELISVVDSLAYVEFGMKKMPEAEALYRRLIDLWQQNAGPEHPMVALTMDKIAEFYAFQQRYDEAEKFASAALALRTRSQMGSLDQTGRVLLMQAKISESEDLYRRAIEIGDLAHAPDDVMDPVLRVYARILREMKHDSEAEPYERRVKEALIRKGDREGRRPSPVKGSSK